MRRMTKTCTDTFCILFRWYIMMFETYSLTISISAFLVVLRLVVLNQNRETQRNCRVKVFSLELWTIQ